MKRTLIFLLLFYTINCQRSKNSKGLSCLGLLSTLSTANEIENGKFTLELMNGPKIYEPYENYAIILKSNDINIHFKEFNIFAESVDQNLKINVGRFERYNEALTKYSDDCPNGVTQSSLLPKQEVKVKWVAPQSGSGCIRFKAAVRSLEYWLTNQNSMSFVICEENQALDGQPKILSRCTACDEAKYGVILTGLWSRNTHPRDFPKNAWDVAISNVVGASHSNNFHIFANEGYATEPLRRLAEDGETKDLSQLLGNRENFNSIRTIIKAKGITHPLLNGKTFAEFRVDKDHHLMSLVAKLIPSPDWFIGVDSLELCLQNGSWIDEKQMNLYLWDAGTDGGLSYQNVNKLPLKFKERIYQINNLHPDKTPFYNINETKIKPFARIKVVRQRLFTTKTACRLIEAPDEEEEPEDSLEKNFVYGDNENVPSIPSLGTYPNSYDDPESVLQYPPETENGNENSYNNGEINSKEVTDSLNQDCKTTEYTDWSECILHRENLEANCGEGVTKRSRKLLIPKNFEDCSNIIVLNDEKKCEVPCESNVNYFQREKSQSDRNRLNSYNPDNKYRKNYNQNNDQNYDSSNGQNYGSSNGQSYDSSNGQNYDSSNGQSYDSSNGQNYDSSNGQNYDSSNGQNYDQNYNSYKNDNYNDKNRRNKYNEKYNSQNQNSYDSYNNQDTNRNDKEDSSENYMNPGQNSRDKQYNKKGKFPKDLNSDKEPYEPDNYKIPKSCKISDWSEWSSCFGDCETLRYANRTRSLLTFEPICLGIPLMEQRVCSEDCPSNNYQRKNGYSRMILNNKNYRNNAYRDQSVQKRSDKVKNKKVSKQQYQQH